MPKLTREQIQRVKESVKTGFFAKSWWKQLSKTITASQLTKDEKALVYTKICEGLMQEIIDLHLDDLSMKFSIDSIHDKVIDMRISWGKGEDKAS